MNVFVLCTGRCGSVSLIHACEQMDNFTCGHEQRAGSIGEQRLDYPENHIESDNRLSWYLGRLHFKYGENAFYVHLQRDLEATARSYAQRKNVGIMNAFASGLLRQKVLSEAAKDPTNVAREICETVNQNITHFLLDKPNKMEIHLESIASGFEELWDRIGATGDKQRALESLTRPGNTSADFKRKNAQIGLVTRVKRAAKSAAVTFARPDREQSFFDR